MWPASGHQEQNESFSITTRTPQERLQYPELVSAWYQLNGNQLSWLASDAKSITLRKELLALMDTAFNARLIKTVYHRRELQTYADSNIADSLEAQKADRMFTDAAIALCKDLAEGYHSGPWVGYDQLTAKWSPALDKVLVVRIITAVTTGSLPALVHTLEPAHTSYIALKAELKRHLERKHNDSAAKVVASMNLYRWIHHFGFTKFIVVNLPEARLRYYEADSMVLDMKTVVGKPSTPSPRFATVCDQAILYPYWYVPPSIIFKEYLPLIKQNPGWLDAHNMQVVDGRGKVLNHYKLNWPAFHSGYFPYSIRQSTGCDNALGVIKFNIITPYGVYLHDTNNKTAFLSGSRFYSHGCIRIEEPIKLGNRILPRQLDTAYLQSCFRDQQPHPVKLQEPVPVFSVYMPVVADPSGRVKYYRDVYKLL